jgi:hypothetical protein
MLSSKAVHQTILKSLLDDEDGKHAAC